MYFLMFPAPADTKTKGNVPVRSSDVGGNVRKEVEEQMEDGGDPDVEEIKDRGLQRSMSPELEPAGAPRSPETSVDCPICQGSFPVTEIEMHAAYCDGDVDERRPEADCFQGDTNRSVTPVTAPEDHLSVD